MNGRQVTLYIIEALDNIPMAHDGLGRTASIDGCLKYQRDMREIMRLIREMRNLIYEHGLTSDEVCEQLGQIVSTSQLLRQKALEPSTG